MKLISKSIKVGNRAINAKVTRQQIDDLKNLYKSFRYKLENESEKLILEKYFNVKYTRKEYIYYSILKKQEIRRLKLLILKKDDLSKILQKILDNSEFVDDPSIQDMETMLVDELTQEINKNVLAKLMSFQYGK